MKNLPAGTAETDMVIACCFSAIYSYVTNIRNTMYRTNE